MNSALMFGAVLLCASSLASAQLDPSGLDLVTITHPNNPAWAGNGTPDDRALGRGSVGYEYRIGRFEITTAQWAEFMNAALDRPSSDRIPHVFPPSQWGAIGTTPSNPGGQRFTVPSGNAMLPAGGIDWRVAAIYCNWLHNDKRTDRAAFLNGAYDVSTFGYTGSVFTDQHAHNPDAKYWIPTWDEWLKAAHWSPTNPDNGGWFAYSNGSNTAPAYGPPGVRVRVTGLPGPDPNGPFATANAGWGLSSFPGFNPYTVALGAYGTTNPWGLFDVAGGTREWTEEVVMTNDRWPTWRRADGSAWAGSQAALADLISYVSAEFPSLSTMDYGFRITAAVPGPSVCVLPLLIGILSMRRIRRRSLIDEQVVASPLRSNQ